MVSPYYHYFNRGVNKEKIFFSDENYDYLIQTIYRFLSIYPVQLVAYCLMPNHYHLLVKQADSKSGSKLIQRVFNTYVQAINRRYHRVGTLFQGSAGSRQINDDSYMNEVIRYIHLNPVYAGLVKSPVDWPYSDCQEWLGVGSTNRNVVAEVGTWFGSFEQYRDFLSEGIENKEEHLLQKYLFEQK